MCKAVLLFFPFFVLFSQIKVGLDWFLEKEKQFSQKKIAFAINHTSCTNQMEFILDVLKTPSFTIAAIFTPEHGLKGAEYAWKSVQDGAHKDIPIYSLHGPRRRPTQDMLKGLDAIVYDMQSIGARSYTYETTLFYLMEESAKAGVKVMREQALGGDIVNIASKNALVSGPNNAGYGTAKAAQTHMSRLLAAELGPDKIKVNVVNPDAVIEGSKIWEGKWAEGRAKAYGISVDQLPAHYAKRTLMNEIISTEDIANAAFAYVSGLLSKSTGNIINVDGGVAAAFVR